WKATSGERVWLAGPSFMLVFPKGERIELYFDGDWPVTLGHLLTAAGCVILLAGVLPVRRRVLEALRPVLDLPPIPAAAALVLATGRWRGRTRGAVLGAGRASAIRPARSRRGETPSRATPARPGPSTPASASPRWRRRGRAADRVHRRHTRLQRGVDNTERLLDFLDRLGRDYEVIIGSNGSTDSTTALGVDLSRRFKSVTFFHLPQRGVGLAFREFVRRAIPS